MVASPPALVQPAPVRPPLSGAALGVLSVPSLGIHARLAQGGADLTRVPFPKVLDAHVAHYPTTALPWQKGTVLISGHRTTWSKPFLHINLLHKGSKIILRTIAHGVYVYEVVKMRIVKPTDFSYAPWNSGHEIALSACHPPHLATYRLVVIGKLVKWRRK